MEQRTIKYTLLIVCLFTIGFSGCEQTSLGRLTLGKQYAERELRSALIDTTQHNVVNSKTVLVKDSLTATAIAESILFSIYGQSNITEQRPYEIYHIDNYWVLTGTLRKGWMGGTFLIIIDDRNSKVIRITHGK